MLSREFVNDAYRVDVPLLESCLYRIALKFAIAETTYLSSKVVLRIVLRRFAVAKMGEILSGLEKVREYTRKNGLGVLQVVEDILEMETATPERFAKAVEAAVFDVIVAPVHGFVVYSFLIIPTVNVVSAFSLCQILEILRKRETIVPRMLLTGKIASFVSLPEFGGNADYQSRHGQTWFQFVQFASSTGISTLYNVAIPKFIPFSFVTYSLMGEGGLVRLLPQEEMYTISASMTAWDMGKWQLAAGLVHTMGQISRIFSYCVVRRWRGSVKTSSTTPTDKKKQEDLCGKNAVSSGEIPLSTVVPKVLKRNFSTDRMLCAMMLETVPCVGSSLLAWSGAVFGEKTGIVFPVLFDRRRGAMFAWSTLVPALMLSGR